MLKFVFVIVQCRFVYLVWMNCLPSWLDLEMCSSRFVVLRKNTFVEVDEVPSMFFMLLKMLFAGAPGPVVHCKVRRYD